MLYYYIIIQLIYNIYSFEQICNHDEIGKQKRLTTTLPKYEKFPTNANKINNGIDNYNCGCVYYKIL